jgi:drug/metabolite transporter (DMT)-like permease
MVGYSVAGFAAAALSPFAMTIGFIIWGKSWQGSAYTLNVFKCSLAGAIFVLVSLIFPSPGRTGMYGQSMVIVSSLIGIVIGDNTWLLALQIIGAKKVIVIDAMKPFFAAFAAYFILKEPLTLQICVGVVVSTIGVIMVSTEKDPEESPTTDEQSDRPAESANAAHGHIKTRALTYDQLMLGYVLAAINVLLDAFGSVLTKQFGTDMNTWEINSIRFGFAAVLMGVITLGMQTWDALGSAGDGERRRGADVEMSESRHALTELVASSEEDTKDVKDEEKANPAISGRNSSASGDEGKGDARGEHDEDSVQRGAKEAAAAAAAKKKKKKWYVFPTAREMSKEQWISVAVGVMFVTFLCPALSNYALFQLPLSVSLTLNSLGPVYSIPLVYLMLHEKSGWQSMVGAALAVAGIAIMCF